VSIDPRAQAVLDYLERDHGIVLPDLPRGEPINFNLCPVYRALQTKYDAATYEMDIAVSALPTAAWTFMFAYDRGDLPQYDRIREETA
jgi:hypothetical protein